MPPPVWVLEGRSRNQSPGWLRLINRAEVSNEADQTWTSGWLCRVSESLFYFLSEYNEHFPSILGSNSQAPYRLLFTSCLGPWKYPGLPGLLRGLALILQNLGLNLEPVGLVLPDFQCLSFPGSPASCLVLVPWLRLQPTWGPVNYQSQKLFTPPLFLLEMNLPLP